VRLIPFRRTFKAEERDPALLDKLKAEAPHILAWLTGGCLDWQRRGLADVPATIKQATGEYQEEQDLMGRWLAECCNLSPSSETSATDAYCSYKNWCLDNGLRPASNVSLGRRLSERRFGSRQSNGKRLWAGIAIEKPPNASDADCEMAYRAAKGW
jgi:phage/plasmid-associated DNA primase